MSSKPPRSTRATRRFDACTERVFDAWLDPAQVRSWLAAATKNDNMGELIRVEIDARVGGSFSFVYRRDGEEILQAGAYLEIIRPRRLTFTWAIALPDIERVLIDVVPAGTGSELTLTHEMDPKWSGDVSPVEAAWNTVLEAIAKTMASGESDSDER